MSDEKPVAYQCPGESYVISRAVHLGRLASYYPKCRDCPHRVETGTLSARRVRRLAEIGRRGPRPGLMYEDCIAGALYTEITPRVVRRLAAALAAYLTEQGSSQRAPVVLGGDGRGPSAELVAAASDGLRWAGCDVRELGAVSAPMLTMALRQTNVAGGLFVGNPLSSIGTAGLKFWGSDGRRLTTSAGLDRIEQLSRSPLRRSGRRYGAASRLMIEEMYLGRLQPYFHALRPLRLVIDCRCGPVWRHLTRLIADTACTLLPLSSRHTPCAVTGDGTRSVPATNPLPKGEGTRTAAFDQIARHVLAERAHAGLWIDGDGETLCLIDETGREVPVEQIAAAIATLGEAPLSFDALHSFALLVTLLSQTDRSVSDLFAR